MSPDYQEYDDFTDAIENQSIFQARHIHKLAKLASPPPSLLLHIDLKHVVHTLGYRAATKEDQEKNRYTDQQSKKTEARSLQSNDIKLPEKSILLKIQRNTHQHD